jgi:hypothetical protein
MTVGRRAGARSLGKSDAIAVGVRNVHPASIDVRGAESIAAASRRAIRELCVAVLATFSLSEIGGP